MYIGDRTALKKGIYVPIDVIISRLEAAEDASFEADVDVDADQGDDTGAPPAEEKEATMDDLQCAIALALQAISQEPPAAVAPALTILSGGNLSGGSSVIP